MQIVVPRSGIHEAVEEKMQPTMKMTKALVPRPQPKSMMKHLCSHLVTRQPIMPTPTLTKAQITRTAEAPCWSIA